MKIDFNVVLKNFDGEEIKNPKGESATLKSVAIEALLAVFQDEQSLSGEEKVKRWNLALKLYNNVDDISVDEIVLIKSLVGKAYGALVVGQVWQLLENKN